MQVYSASFLSVITNKLIVTQYLHKVNGVDARTRRDRLQLSYYSLKRGFHPKQRTQCYQRTQKVRNKSNGRNERNKSTQQTQLAQLT